MWRRKSLAVNIIAVFLVFNILSIVFFRCTFKKVMKENPSSMQEKVP